MSRMDLNGKKVWLTGASSGIGAALARVLHARGAWLCLVARRRDRMESLRRELSEPDRVVIEPADLSDEAERIRLWEQSSARHGCPDVWVHNAGIAQRAKARDADLASVRRIMEINFFAPVHLTRLSLPAMVERGSGHLAIVSSVVGYVSTPRRSTYAASKHALHGWFEAVRAEEKTHGIGVTMVCPGYVRTEVGAHALRADGRPQGSAAREKGMDPGLCAERIVRALEKGRPEIHVGGPEIGGIWVRRFAPGLFRWLAPRMVPR